MVDLAAEDLEVEGHATVGEAPVAEEALAHRDFVYEAVAAVELEQRGWRVEGQIDMRRPVVEAESPVVFLAGVGLAGRRAEIQGRERTGLVVVHSMAVHYTEKAHER